jgi:hypothetical protein
LLPAQAYKILDNIGVQLYIGSYGIISGVRKRKGFSTGAGGGSSGTTGEKSGGIQWSGVRARKAANSFGGAKVVITGCVVGFSMLADEVGQRQIWS